MSVRQNYKIISFSSHDNTYVTLNLVAFYIVSTRNASKCLIIFYYIINFETIYKSCFTCRSAIHTDIQSIANRLSFVAFLESFLFIIMTPRSWIFKKIFKLYEAQRLPFRLAFAVFSRSFTVMWHHFNFSFNLYP